MNTITLNTGTEMPILGLGTWKSPADQAGAAVEHALTKAGYKHIDCAAIYRNESEIGQIFAKVFNNDTVKREDIFITSKLWNISHEPKRVRETCEKTLHDLQLDYLDLYLMHWGVAENFPEDSGKHADGIVDQNGKLNNPKVSIRETWEAMEELVSAGLVKNIGVANFTGMMIVDLLSYAKILPVVNQIELHPYNQQTRLVEFCQKQGIAVTAYSPLGTPGNVKTRAQGEPVLIEDPVILTIAGTHQKTPAQILIRWATQRNTIVIPKSVTPSRIEENIQVFNFTLTEDEMKAIKALDKKLRFVDPFGWWGVPYFE